MIVLIIIAYIILGCLALYAFAEHDLRTFAVVIILILFPFHFAISFFIVILYVNGVFNKWSK